MRSFTVALVAGAGVLLASSAFAGPMTNGINGVSSDASIQQVRIVCDDSGRCFKTRGARRATVDRGPYNYYAPRDRYQQRRYNRHNRHNRAPGFGIQVPGVSIGVGGNRW